MQQWESALSLRACLRGGGGFQVGEITCLGGVNYLSIKSLIWSPHLSCTAVNVIKIGLPLPKVNTWVNLLTLSELPHPRGVSHFHVNRS